MLSFEVNLNLLFVNRDGYTFIDVLSDVGGINAILVSGISIFLTLWNYKHFDSYMAKHLYKMSRGSGGSSVEGDEDQMFFRPTKLANIKYLCMD